VEILEQVVEQERGVEKEAVAVDYSIEGEDQGSLRDFAAVA
jgi:hypothetical protein